MRSCVLFTLLLLPSVFVEAMAHVLRSKPTIRNSILFICDIQERFRTIIHNMPTVIAQSSMLVDVCQKLGVPRLVTEQYKTALGATVPELGIEDGEAVDKKVFSMLIPPVIQRLEASPNIKHVGIDKIYFIKSFLLLILCVRRLFYAGLKRTCAFNRPPWT